MTVSLTIRDLPEELRDRLKERAEAALQSINSYLLDILERESGLPTMAEWADTVVARRRFSDLAVDPVAVLRVTRDTT